MVALQTAEAAVPGSNPASPTMILMRCRIIVIYCKISRDGDLPLRQKKRKERQKMFC